MQHHSKRSLADILERLPGLKRKGKQYEGPCPLCGGTNRFHVEEGAAVEILMGCRQCEAPFAEFMRELFPEDFERRNGVPKMGHQPTPACTKKGTKKGTKTEGGKWAVHTYGGAYWATVTRLDYEGGGKEFRYSHEVQGQTVWRLPPGERYLFNGVAAFKDTAAPLLVVEGEKAAARGCRMAGRRFERTGCGFVYRRLRCRQHCQTQLGAIRGPRCNDFSGCR